MLQPAIKIEGLWKEYTVGARDAGYTTFREVITGALAAPFRRFQRTKGDASEEQRFWALKDVSFEIQPGEVIGIIGRNGAGKSTLLKILSRITEPTRGQVQIRGRVSSLLEVGTGFHPELTGRENIFLNGAILGMGRKEIQRKFDEIVAFAEVERFIGTPVKHYSSGMYVRLAFAVAAHLDPEVLIVDEVLAVGDAAFQNKCLGKMGDLANADGRTVLLVSHNVDSVSKLCSRALLLEGGAIASEGIPVQVIEEYLGKRDAPSEGHVITLQGEHIEEFYVNRIELLDDDQQPIAEPKTWDAVNFRITYYVPEALQGGCVVLQVSTLSGTPLIVCTTTPDRTFPAPFTKGQHVISCRMPRLPLAAGRYRIGAALAVPFQKWLSSSLEKGHMEVHTCDVYGSGLPPRTDRYLIAVDYDWNAG